MSQSGLRHAVTEPDHLDAKRERTRRAPAGRAATLRRAPSDSDCSAETASLSADSADRVRPTLVPIRTTKQRSRRRGSEWEVLEGLKDGQRFERRPEVFNGYLHKKRKWPLKGWHKRFFVVDGGILVYARSPTDVARGRLHGSVDVGLSVISAKARRRRIDIDADEFIYHLRAKTPDVFRTWLSVLKAHRLYRQHLLTFGARESAPKIHVPLDELPPTETSSRLASPASPPVRAQAGFVAGTPGGRLANWIVESGGPLEVANRDLGQAQLSVQQLQRLLDAIQLSHHHDTDQVSVEGASPNVKKDRRKFGLRKKKSNSKCASVELHVDANNSHSGLSALTAPPSPGGGASSLPNSAASLPMACAAARPQSLPGAEALGASVGGGPASLASLTPDQQLKEDFTILAKDLVTTLKGVVSTLVVERGRLRAAMDTEGGAGGGGVVAALRTNLSSALQQNEELRSRLCRIHDASDIAEMSSVNNTDPVTRQFPQSLSYSSSCVSASEFYDAEEHEQGENRDILPAVESGVIELDGDSSSDASLSSEGEEGEEGSGGSSDNSDHAMLDVESDRLRSLDPASSGLEPGGFRRRSRLPSPRPTPGGPSLWNLLYKNIGKDLSQVSMPVTINEPLNMLQRLCEELEYCELLDRASECSDPLERLALIALFAVSPYAATAHRAASKPFNPLLGETYECRRPDRGFQFAAEQVSHHPPISACHASSPRWVFWQEARIKTRFWGKSMEFQPAGRVHVTLLPSQLHYSWNKVTTCVHNLFGGQRWVDQYGDMHVTCHGTSLTAKLSFLKASSWSSSRHEVRGVVSDPGSGDALRLGGRWSEEMKADNARLLWRPGPMPADHELYYGFTRFAMELNEMEPGMRDALPHTDTRFRPDQRALEEGDVEAAERYKHSLEQAQRERRRGERAHQPLWFRKAVEDGEETWVFTGEYWQAREEGFSAVSIPRLW